MVQNNVCANNGLSPRLARYQGAFFLSTWNKGVLSGIRIENNRIEWNPAVDAPALINNAEFKGFGSFKNNVIHSFAPSLIASNASLKLDGNTYEYTGAVSPIWQYASKSYTVFRPTKEGRARIVTARTVTPTVLTTTRLQEPMR